jgi:hypothetical protein
MGGGSSIFHFKSVNTNDEVFDSFQRITSSVDTLRNCSQFGKTFLTFLESGSWIDDMLSCMKKNYSYYVSPILQDKMKQNDSTKSSGFVSLHSMFINLPQKDFQALIIFVAYPIFLRSATLNYWLLHIESPSGSSSLEEIKQIEEEKNYVQALISLNTNTLNDDEDDEDTNERQNYTDESLDDQNIGDPPHEVTPHLYGDKQNNRELLTEHNQSLPSSSTNNTMHARFPFIKAIVTNFENDDPSPIKASFSPMAGTEERGVAETPHRLQDVMLVSLHRKDDLQGNQSHRASSSSSTDQLISLFRTAIPPIHTAFHDMFANRSWSKHLHAALNGLPVGIAITEISLQHNSPWNLFFHHQNHHGSSSLPGTPTSYARTPIRPTRISGSSTGTPTTPTSPSSSSPRTIFKLLFLNHTWEAMMMTSAKSTAVTKSTETIAPSMIGLNYFDCIHRASLSDLDSLDHTMQQLIPTVSWHQFEDELHQSHIMLIMMKPVKAFTQQQRQEQEAKYHHNQSSSSKAYSHAIFLHYVLPIITSTTATTTTSTTTMTAQDLYALHELMMLIQMIAFH